MLWIVLLEIDDASLIDPSTHVELFSHYFDGPSVFSSSEKIGSKKGGEMQLWTKDEYLRFGEAVMDKSLSFHAFELLYWTGIRCGELLALTPSDFMLESSRLRINKSYQSLHGVDTVTDPKTPKSVRMIVMPAFLRGGEAFCERSESTEGLDGGLAKEVRLAAPPTAS